MITRRCFSRCEGGRGGAGGGACILQGSCTGYSMLPSEKPSYAFGVSHLVDWLWFESKTVAGFAQHTLCCIPHSYLPQGCANKTRTRCFNEFSAWASLGSHRRAPSPGKLPLRARNLLATSLKNTGCRENSAWYRDTYNRSSADNAWYLGGGHIEELIFFVEIGSRHASSRAHRTRLPTSRSVQYSTQSA